MGAVTTAVLSSISALATGYSAVKQTEAYEETKQIQKEQGEAEERAIAEQKRIALNKRKQKIDLQRKQLGYGSGNNFSTLTTGGTGVPKLTESLG